MPGRGLGNILEILVKIYSHPVAGSRSFRCVEPRSSAWPQDRARGAAALPWPFFPSSALASMPERQNNLEDGHRISYTLKPTDLESAGKYGSPFWRLNHFFYFRPFYGRLPRGKLCDLHLGAIAPMEISTPSGITGRSCARRVRVYSMCRAFPTVAGPLRAS